jgi:hypothetical protein
MKLGKVSSLVEQGGPRIGTSYKYHNTSSKKTKMKKSMAKTPTTIAI